MSGERSFAKAPSLTKGEAKPRVAAGLARAVAARGLERIAMQGGCTTRCIQKAIAGETLPELHTALNIAALEPDAATDILSFYGLGIHLLDPGALPDAAALAALALLLSEVAEAMRDGRIDRVELGRIVAKAVPVLPWLNGCVAQVSRERVSS